MKGTIVDTHNGWTRLKIGELQEIIDQAGKEQHKTTVITIDEDLGGYGDILVVYTGDVEPDIEDLIVFLDL